MNKSGGNNQKILIPKLGLFDNAYAIIGARL
jgi:hypothetical protein